MQFNKIILKEGFYIARTVGWKASNLQKKKPGYWKYYYTFVNVRENDNGELVIQIIGYNKDIKLTSDTIRNWEYSVFNPEKDESLYVKNIIDNSKLIQPEKPCWETKPELDWAV